MFSTLFIPLSVEFIRFSLVYFPELFLQIGRQVNGGVEVLPYQGVVLNISGRGFEWDRDNADNEMRCNPTRAVNGTSRSFTVLQEKFHMGSFMNIC